VDSDLDPQTQTWTKSGLRDLVESTTLLTNFNIFRFTSYHTTITFEMSNCQFFSVILTLSNIVSVL